MRRENRIWLRIRFLMREENREEKRKGTRNIRFREKEMAEVYENAKKNMREKVKNLSESFRKFNPVAVPIISFFFFLQRKDSPENWMKQSVKGTIREKAKSIVWRPSGKKKWRKIDQKRPIGWGKNEWRRKKGRMVRIEREASGRLKVDLQQPKEGQ